MGGKTLAVVALGNWKLLPGTLALEGVMQRCRHSRPCSGLWQSPVWSPKGLFLSMFRTAVLPAADPFLVLSSDLQRWFCELFLPQTPFLPMLAESASVVLQSGSCYNLKFCISLILGWAFFHILASLKSACVLWLVVIAVPVCFGHRSSYCYFHWVTCIAGTKSVLFQ